MSSVVVVDAVRTPIGRRLGGLQGMHSADLLATVLAEVVRRSGVPADEVEQIIGGCVGQVGMQAFNVTRTAALVAGLPVTVGATTVDTQCGSGQQSVALAHSLIAAGTVDVAIACGVENMSCVPMGANMGTGVGKGIPKSYFAQYQYTSQFQGAELIARKWGLTREDLDAFGLRSQQLAAQAWEQDRFAGQILNVDAPDLDDEGRPTGTTHVVSRDEGLRASTIETLAGLRAVVGADDRVLGPEPGMHTAATSSQIADGAGAVLLASEEAAARLGLTPRARVIDTCLVGSDPVLMLTGPIDATHRLLARTKLTPGDFGVVEINEAFASVVLAWQREFTFPEEIVNPNGGAIALGHPLGATGAILVAKALDELERTGSEHALVTMCCGGGVWVPAPCSGLYDEGREMTIDADAPLRRPVPVPDAGSQAYWAGAREGRLMITRCEACRRYVHPPQPFCPQCFHQGLSAVEMSGRGRVHAFSIMHLPGVPGFQPPFAVAVVELEEQARLITVGNVLDCPLEDISVGMPVVVAFEELNDTVTLPQWRRADA